MIRRELISRNLINLSVPYEDKNKNSTNFINVTSKLNSLKSGKNIFTFKPNYDYLSKRFPIVFEIIDINGKPLFYQSTQLLDDDGSNIISIHVYDNIPSGIGSIIFVATTEYDLELNQIPINQIVENNFKYVHTIEINSTERNDSKILITDDPTFNAEEISAYIVEEKFTDKKIERYYGTGSFLYSPSVISFFDIPEGFTQDMIGGKIYFPKIAQNYFPTSSFTIQENPYNSIITDVRSPGHITLSNPCVVSASDGIYANIQTTITRIEKQEYYIEYNKLSENRIATQNLKPYVKIDVDKLNTFSGKISQVKVYTKSSAKPDSEYALSYDDEVYPKNILVDKSSSLIEYPIGIFNNKIDVKRAGSESSSSYFAIDYWDVKRLNGAPTAQKNTGSFYLPDGVYLTPSAIMSGSQELMLEQTSSASSKFYPNTEYTLLFDYHLAEPVNDIREQKIEVYISGSAFISDTIYGKYIVTVPPANVGMALVRNYQVPILPNFEGDGVIKFILRDNAVISNIRIQESVDSGFSPNRLTLYVPIKTDHKNEYVDLKFDFFDHTYNKANKSFYLKSIFFNGGNHYIFGDDNIITGSTFVSPFSSSGIEIYSNIKPSASILTSGSSIRSYGYHGIDFANNNPQTASNFGWSLTTGNPFVSSSYSNASVQMINKSGSKFDFRVHPDKFNLSVVGNNSYVLIGNSGSISESYLQWDSVDLKLKSKFLTGSLSGTSSYAETASYSNYVSNIKSGVISNVQWQPNLALNYTASVNFNTAYLNTSYAITITAASDVRNFSITNKTFNGFSVDTNSGTPMTNDVYWVAVPYNNP